MAGNLPEDIWGPAIAGGAGVFVGVWGCLWGCGGVCGGVGVFVGVRGCLWGCGGDRVPPFSETPIYLDSVYVCML